MRLKPMSVAVVCAIVVVSSAMLASPEQTTQTPGQMTQARVWVENRGPHEALPVDLRAERNGRRVRVAGMVITRQRPGTAKGFVFLTLEDETGIANIIVRPDLFARDRLVIVEEPFLIVDGVLQNQDGVTSVRAEQVQGMRGVDVDFDAHDFY